MHNELISKIFQNVIKLADCAIRGCVFLCDVFLNEHALSVLACVKTTPRFADK